MSALIIVAASVFGGLVLWTAVANLTCYDDCYPWIVIPRWLKKVFKNRPRSRDVFDEGFFSNPEKSPKQKTLRIVEKKTAEGESYFVIKALGHRNDWETLYRKEYPDGNFAFYSFSTKGAVCQWATIEKALEVMEEYKESLAKQKEAAKNEKYSEVMLEE